MDGRSSPWSSEPVADDGTAVAGADAGAGAEVDTEVGTDVGGCWHWAGRGTVAVGHMTGAIYLVSFGHPSVSSSMIVQLAKSTLRSLGLDMN